MDDVHDFALPAAKRQRVDNDEPLPARPTGSRLFAPFRVCTFHIS
jgi:hypothetical protein